MTRRRMPLWLGWSLTALVVAGFCSLGSWQLGRAQQKEAMLAQADALLAERSAGPLANAGIAGERQAYAWSAGRGRFAAAPAILLDNQNRAGRPGVRAYRVFQPEGDAMPLLVELGWLPLPGDRRLPPVEMPADVHDISGLLAPPPSEGLARAVAAPQSNGDILTTGLHARNLPALLHVPAIAPRVLKLDPSLPFGYARDLDILPNTLPPERHVGYAVQWFGLALAVLVTAAIVTWRGRRKRGAGLPPVRK